MDLFSIGKFKSFTIFLFTTQRVAPGSSIAYVLIEFPFFPWMTRGTIERATPPPEEIPASHAESIGVVGVAAFTAKVVWFGTNFEAALFSVTWSAAW